MTNLKKLELQTMFQFEKHLPRIGSCLENLKEFSFFCYNGFEKAGPKKIMQNLLAFVERAAKLTLITSLFFNSIDASELCEKLMNIRKTLGNTEILSIQGIPRTKWPRLSSEQKNYIKFTEMNGKAIMATQILISAAD